MNKWLMFLRATNGLVFYFLKYFVMTFSRTQNWNDSRITIKFGFLKYYIALQLRKGDDIVEKTDSKTKSTVFTA